MELTTRSGTVRGQRAGGVVRLRGIPFAAPPAGDLRFEAPQRERPWSGVREANAFGSAPPQRSDAMIDALGLLGDPEIGEDCLTLNVWTPGLDAARRPILVWIHGGAFLNGTGAAPIYDGARMAARGDVVVVTLNYRVGAWGFLHHPSLGPPNRGLLDQLAALAWVREHARAIGGDPERITVFGESAGAGSICALLAMPAARGAFRRAIIQSAAPDGVLGADEAERRACALASLLGIREPGLRRLAEVPVEALLDAQADCIASRVWRTGMFYGPVVDGDVLPCSPLSAAESGETAGVDLIVGTTADEMRLFLWGVDADAVPDEVADAGIAFELPGAAPDGQPAARRVRAQYEALRRRRGLPCDPASVLAAVQSDTRLRLPSLRLAERHAAHHRETRVYSFDQASAMPELGACHALDLPFTFGTLDAPGMPAFAGNGRAERRVSDAMIEAWTRFARDGDPGGGVLGAWPPFAVPERATMAIGPRPGVSSDPFAAERAILDAIEAPAAARPR